MSQTTVPDEEILDAIEDAIENDETDISGGAPPPAVSARVQLTTDTVSDRLRDLAEAGEIEQVWGWSRLGAPARQSYRIPADKD